MSCFQNNNLFIWSWSMVIGISGEILPLVVVWFCYVGTEYFWNMLFMVPRIHIDSKKLADFGTKYENVYIINEHSYECVTKMSCSWQVKMFHHFILHSSKLISYLFWFEPKGLNQGSCMPQETPSFYITFSEGANRRAINQVSWIPRSGWIPGARCLDFSVAPVLVVWTP